MKETMKHILMVDDNATNLKSAAEVLRDTYKLSMAKSGKQALKFLEKNTPDLILLDIMMPEMDGYQTMEEIKLHPNMANIPIIFLTSDTEQASEVRGLKMGAMDFITKPFVAGVMLGRIAQVLQMDEMRKSFSGLTQANNETSYQESQVKEGFTMNTTEMIHHIDHTLLKAFADEESIFSLCEEAIRYQTASVCIPASYVKRVKEKYKDMLKICTVIGFPLGYSTTAVKVFETKDAVENGADEIDMVINIGDVKNNNFDLVEDEICRIREAAKGKVLKVIIETCYLTESEKIKLCEIVTRAGADYIKTSTGFGTSGAQLTDIELFKQHIGPEVKIKAAGGMRTKEALSDFINAGCDRIGSSSTKEFITN